MLAPAFFGGLSHFNKPFLLRSATFKFLGTGLQELISFLFRSFLEKLIPHVSTLSLYRRVLNGIAISTVHLVESLVTLENHLLSQFVVTPKPPPFCNRPSRCTPSGFTAKLNPLFPSLNGSRKTANPSETGYEKSRFNDWIT